MGITASTAPFVILMNNDTEAVSNWLEKLHRPLFIQYKAGLSGPLTTTPHSWQGKYPKGKSGYVIRNSGMIAFFCTMFKREVFENVGLLDENFGVGFGDDDDYCRRVLNAGYSLALVQDLVIPHHHRTTFKQLYKPETIQEMQKNAIDHFYEKHNLKKK
jgi:GT2 family glycosyltransferase